MPHVTLFLPLVLLLALTPAARPGADDAKLFDAVWRTVERAFYDDEHHGVDWEEVREIYRPLVLRAESDRRVRALLLEMLAELRASHTTIIDGDVYRGVMAELTNRPTLTYGLLVEESLPGRYFVRGIYEGGPGDAAGLLVGDRIVAIDGVPFDESPAVVDAGYDPALPGPALFFLRAEEGTSLRLLIQTNADAASRRETTIRPRRMNAVDAARNSVSIVEQDGFRIGTLHLWFCSRGADDALEAAVTGPLADCDALVLDVRGRGGFSDVASRILDVFRGGRGLGRRLRGLPPAEPRWTRPVVLLIDDRSRSAKEILAYRFREANLGRLVGQRTEGAVLGAMFHPLPDGSYLELAGVAVPVGDVNLEGVGVPPDHDVDFVVPYANGYDPIFEKGVAVAVDLARAAGDPTAVDAARPAAAPAQEFR